MNNSPEFYYLTSGWGEGTTALNAFDSALLTAQIGHYNLTKVTSVAPPNVKKAVKISPAPGSIVPAAFASIYSESPGQIISAAVAIALPSPKHLPGIIMEHSDFASKEVVENLVREMAMEAMRLRGFDIDILESTAVEHKVMHRGCALAAVLLW
jgi:arginine decarboxylase